MKKLTVILSVLALVLLLAACQCKHEWYAASCSAPKTCSLCQATEGEALPHTWQDATCTEAKTCTVCKATEGEPLGHTWQDATCTTVKTCTVCQATEGEALGHTWVEATCTAPKTCSVCSLTEGETVDHSWEEATTEAPQTCTVCQATEGSKLQTDSRFTTASTKELQGTWTCNMTLTDEMLGLEGFGDVYCVYTLTFGKTGELTQAVSVEDEGDFMESMKKFYIDLMYESFAQEGMSKSQADQAMLDAYGLNVKDYVDAELKNYDVGQIFDAYTTTMVYYVEDGKVCTALTWKAKFEKDKYTIEDGKLTIEGLTMMEGGDPLVFVKAGA